MAQQILQSVDSRYVAIYLRSATSGPEANAKTAKCRDHCQTVWGGHGPIFDDTGISGLRPDRPALDSLLQQAAAGSIKVVVVHDSSAVARDMFLYRQITDRLTGRGVTIDFVEPDSAAFFFPTDDPLEEDRAFRAARMKTGRDRAKLKREEVAAGKATPS